MTAARNPSRLWSDQEAGSQPVLEDHQPQEGQADEEIERDGLYFGALSLGFPDVTQLKQELDLQDCKAGVIVRSASSPVMVVESGLACRPIIGSFINHSAGFGSSARPVGFVKITAH